MFRVRPFETKTLSWWYHERDNIDMEPIYQRRGRLWPKPDKAYLIDSILNDFDIPKIYIADFTYVNTPLNTARRPYAIIDGKQRFEAIFDFFDGGLTLVRSFVYSDDPSLQLGGLGLKDLRSNYPKIASKFENFNLSVVSVITDDDARINELFVRLNRSKPLTGAEVRNAMVGVYPQLIRGVAQHRFFEACVGFTVARGQDLNAAAKLLLIEFRGELVETKRVNLDRFVREGVSSQTDDVQTAANRVGANLDQMAEIFVRKDPLLATQGPVTVYYWLVRTFGRLYGPVIREFLVQFEESRRANKRLSRESPFQADQEMLSYDNYARSVNDQGSLEARFQILSSRLELFGEMMGIRPRARAPRS